MFKFSLAAVSTLAIWAAAVGVAAAAGVTTETAAGFAGQQNTNTNTNLGYLFAIYIITWAGFFAYVLMVSRRQKDIERELARLRERLGEEPAPQKERISK